MAQLSEVDRDGILQRYGDRLREFGVDLRTLNPGDLEKYRKQHQVHSEIGNLDGRTVLDVGCGLAHYFEFLRSKNVGVSYIGYDIVAPFIDINRSRFPDAEFHCHDISREEIRHAADYITFCQVFNNKYRETNNVEVVTGALTKAFAAARQGVSIDMLSSYVNYQEDHLAYFEPERMFSIAKSITPFVTLRHDYLPFHFTLYLHKNQCGA